MTKLILAAAITFAVSMAAIAQPVVQPPGGVPLLKEFHTPFRLRR